jgi:hypothetical protein
MEKGKHPNSLAALEPTKWKKGEKPKGAGRPKGAVSITESLRRSLDRIAQGMDPIDKKAVSMPMRDWVGVALITKAASGDVAAIRELLNRIDGTIVGKIEVTGKDGQPLQTGYDQRLSEIYERASKAFGSRPALSDETPAAE